MPWLAIPDRALEVYGRSLAVPLQTTTCLALQRRASPALALPWKLMVLASPSNAAPRRGIPHPGMRCPTKPNHGSLSPVPSPALHCQVLPNSAVPWKPSPFLDQPGLGTRYRTQTSDTGPNPGSLWSLPSVAWPHLAIHRRTLPSLGNLVPVPRRTHPSAAGRSTAVGCPTQEACGPCLAASCNAQTITATTS